MPQLILEIKAQDFFETDYLGIDDCVITRALKRGGYDMHDEGTGIYNNQYAKVIGMSNSDYYTMSQLVLGMYDYLGKTGSHYATKTEPKDFTYVINY